MTISEMEDYLRETIRAWLEKNGTVADDLFGTITCEIDDGDIAAIASDIAVYLGR